MPERAGRAGQVGQSTRLVDHADVEPPRSGAQAHVSPVVLDELEILDAAEAGHPTYGELGRLPRERVRQATVVVEVDPAAVLVEPAASAGATRQIQALAEDALPAAVAAMCEDCQTQPSPWASSAS